LTLATCRLKRRLPHQRVESSFNVLYATMFSATLPLAEFAAVVGNLRGARFGRDSAWRTAAILGALDEFRHAQIPLMLMHEITTGRF
jgi:hypothetical protein